MKSENLIGAVIGAILKIVATIVVVYLVYTGAMKCYDYGYRVFTEPAVSSGTGRDVTVTVTEDMSPAEIGELFYSRGLTRDAKLFALQYIFSEYHEEVVPGTFDLNTAMTAEEMMAVMAAPETEENTN